MELHFSDRFEIDPNVLRGYGAFDVSVVSDLPLFIDPFLLFNSENPRYQELHNGILKYLIYLRDRAQEGEDFSVLASLYMFGEVKQNWLGFTLLGNGGRGLGVKFARSLHGALRGSLSNFGEETITRASHLEKLTLISSGVGRDNISDFTTNLIKEYLCEFTSRLATDHLSEEHRSEFAVERVRFSYETETWETRRYVLPKLNGDFVLLTPYDLLTRDDTWINHGDMVRRFPHIADAIPDDQLRSQVDRYFKQHLKRNPSKAEEDDAVRRTIQAFPELIDRYIRIKEDSGSQATRLSKHRVEETDAVFVRQLKALTALLDSETNFYGQPISSYEESLARAQFFKHYIEEKGGWQLINKRGKPFSNESDVQLYFGLTWYGTLLDVSREPQTGRGPVDFKASRGALDKSLIEFKLASNSHLKRNLEKQVEIYKKAEQTKKAVTVIVCYTEKDEAKLGAILKMFPAESLEHVVVIDARSDNKPSASKA